jgi:RNA polymerase sigma-70 factor (ECF subfamily)
MTGQITGGIVMLDNTMDCREVVDKVKRDGMLHSLELNYYKCLSDEELVQMYVDDSLEGAFNELVDRHGDKIFRTAYRITGDMNAAEEVLQNVFIILVQSLRSFRNDSKFTTWLYKVAMNTSFMYLRSKKKVNDSEMKIEDLTRFDESGNLQDVFLKDWSNVPEDKILSKEGKTKLEEAIDELPEKYKTVFQLKDIEGLPNQEVADVLDLSLPAVKSRALRARLFLRERLSDYYQEYI